LLSASLRYALDQPSGAVRVRRRFNSFKISLPYSLDRQINEIQGFEVFQAMQLSNPGIADILQITESKPPEVDQLGKASQTPVGQVFDTAQFQLTELGQLPQRFQCPISLRSRA
jgi:hypothetical protein